MELFDKISKVANDVANSDAANKAKDVINEKLPDNVGADVKKVMNEKLTGEKTEKVRNVVNEKLPDDIGKTIKDAINGTDKK